MVAQADQGLAFAWAVERLKQRLAEPIKFKCYGACNSS
ncbi:hypothetical protein NIES2104_65130 [Leptolyngbya sp. NIES-2104]|nr:hypothetical protein NIES2104_65130 [Leptolyngbya sp. NIES-2104]